MYSTFNFSKHINPYNFILWLFIDGIFFLLKSESETGRETACVLSVGAQTTRRRPSASRAQLLPSLELSTHNYIPTPPPTHTAPQEAVSVQWFPGGSLLQVKCCVSGDLMLQLLEVFKHKPNSQLKWIQSKGGFDKKTLKVISNWEFCDYNKILSSV